MAQNYSNHRRFYAPHHFILIPLATFLLVHSIFYGFHHPQDHVISIELSLASFLLLWTTFMMRQHYGLKNQNRTIRLEMRLRYFQLTGVRLETVEDKLSFGQLAALRFASDKELPALLDRAVKENLSPGEIKKSIVDWVADTMRV